MHNFYILLSCLLLTACASGSSLQKEAPSPSKDVPASSFQVLRTALAAVPGAQIAEGEPLVVSFPVGTLFAQDSVLPMPGGTAPLDALAAVLKQSGVMWKLKVRAASGEGEGYDLELANLRVKVLRTYFKSSGVNLRKIETTVVAESGAPLELKPIQ